MNCTFANNIAYNGSSIYTQPDTQNQVTKNAGIVIQDRNLVIEHCLFQNNAALGDGGCIANFGGQVCIENSTFYHNYAASNMSRGGAIYNNASGVRDIAAREGEEDILIVRNCSFSDNKAGLVGTAIYSEGTGLLLESSEFSRNNGTSPIYARNEHVIVKNCNISNNLGPYGSHWAARRWRHQLLELHCAY